MPDPRPPDTGRGGSPPSGPPLVLRPSVTTLVVEALVALVGLAVAVVGVPVGDPITIGAGVLATGFGIGGLRSRVRADVRGVEVVGRIRRRTISWEDVAAVKVGTERDLSPVGRIRVVVLVRHDDTREVLAPTRRFDMSDSMLLRPGGLGGVVGPFDRALEGLRRRLAAHLAARGPDPGADGPD